MGGHPKGWDEWDLDEEPDLASVHRIMSAEAQFERDRQRLHRAYVDGFVLSASPLLLDVAELWGFDVPAALRGLRAPPGWPIRWRAARERLTGARIGGPRGVNVEHLLGACPPRRRMLPSSGSQQAVSLAAFGGTLQASARMGSVRCFGVDQALEIWIHGPIPETAALACIGKPLATVVEHPLLRRREYPIRQAMADVGGWTVLVSDAPALPKPSDWIAGD